PAEWRDWAGLPSNIMCAILSRLRKPTSSARRELDSRANRGGGQPSRRTCCGGASIWPLPRTRTGTPR
ncbi:hypothetical protein CFC21_082729, partial [Triticum aestivum]